MALGAIELAAIARSQDYTTIKHNEDTKGLAQQNNLAHNMQQEVTQKTKQVNQGEDADWQKKREDAREKGNGSYSGDGGRDRKKRQEPDGRVIAKRQGGFDIKI